MRKMVLPGVLAAFAAVVVVLAGFLIWAHISYPTTSALNVLNDELYARDHPHLALRAQTMAFLPYWRLDNIQYARYDLLSEVDFFGLTIGPDGHFVRVIGNQVEPGWTWWNTQGVQDLIVKARIDGDRFGLTLSMLNNPDIRAFLSNSNAWQSLIKDTIDQIRTRSLSGITLDVEFDGTPGARLRRAFTAFAHRFSSALRHETPGVELDLTLTPLAAREKTLFDLPRLVPLFDRFIGMSYDYYNSSSDVAGPDAPMRGFVAHKFFFDVTTTYSDYRRFIPARRIVMGIPYYGYDWAVRKAGQLMGRTLPANNPNSYAAILSYGRMRTDQQLTNCRWNSLAQEEQCWYFAGRTPHEVWVENERAIAAKYAYAKANGFAGIAVWVLGYDSKYPDLWNLMERTFRA